MADNIVKVILEINEYVTTNCQNGNFKELERNFFKFKNKFAIPYIWEPLAKYFVLKGDRIILKREEQPFSDVNIKIFRHKNINDILLRFTHEYNGKIIYWSFFEELNRYDKELIRELTDEQKKIILDDFRRGRLHSGKDIAVFDEKTLLNRTCYAKRGCESKFSDKLASICDIMYRTLINHNTKDNVEKFTSIINLCTKEVFTDKIMEKDNDKINTKLKQATNYKRFRRSVSPTDNIQTIYNNDGNNSYREIKSTNEARNNAESYKDYFELLIYVVQIVEKSPRYQLYIDVSAKNHWDGTTSYIKEVIPN
ncbi:hypothetical protein COBT_003360 [Conglomerata obtusa]